MSKKSREYSRKRRHQTIRRKISGTVERPRLVVYRSLNDIYAQVIDDTTGQTLVSASSIDNQLKEKLQTMKKSDQAKQVGKALAERAKAKSIAKVVFDRGGYRYMGRVKALADSAREAGLDF
jgi:large subunit ribosomal protein L18